MYVHFVSEELKQFDARNVILTNFPIWKKGKWSFILTS